ncbi:T9SS type A sorting domain-containing protein [Larkinella insperata]|uniref:T9SS type A sorting domain-containing protein n=1 Tax=Larkinella insperata TaxID=332158 RepID=A0ABW3QHE7_9BACT|nr:T9SS type A sorting domain-containing protein [Larkinella insperata]
MKTFISSVLVALALSTSTATFANNDNEKTATSYQVGLYPSVETAKINVMVAKEKGTTLDVALLDGQGTVLATHRLTKNETSTRTRFDLNQLQDGVYTIVVSDGSSKVSKEVNLQTKKPVQAERAVSLR